VSGKVIDITAVSGEYHTDTSTPILTVADLSTVWVAADVPEDQVRFAKVGNPVHITINAYPGEVFEGRVMRIALPQHLDRTDRGEFAGNNAFDADAATYPRYRETCTGVDFPRFLITTPSNGWMRSFSPSALFPAAHGCAPYPPAAAPANLSALVLPETFNDAIHGSDSRQTHSGGVSTANTISNYSRKPRIRTRLNSPRAQFAATAWKECGETHTPMR